MTNSINKVIIIGNVGSIPEIKTMQTTGDKLAIFSIATGEKWKDKNSGEFKEKTDWHKVVVFSPVLVQLIENYVKKGTKVYIEGKLQTREYQDKTGVRKYITEIILSSYNSILLILDAKNTDTLLVNKNRSQNYNNNDKSNTSDENDMNLAAEIPF